MSKASKDKHGVNRDAMLRQLIDFVSKGEYSTTQ